MNIILPSLCKTAIMVLLSMLTLLFSWNGAEAATVGAGYQSIRGGNVIFTVQVGSPAPTSLIVEHFHPRGTNLLSASPGATKINNGEGIAKWFLKNPKPGSYQFSLSFNIPVNPSNLKLIVRYRDPRSGSFRESVVQP